MKNKTSNVDIWIESAPDNVVQSLENASRNFSDDDSLTINTLEAIYGQESSFGSGDLRKRGMSGAAGHFQIEKKTAARYNLSTIKGNDQRFDIDESSDVAAKHLKNLDSYFDKVTNLGSEIYTIPVKNKDERKLFAIAAYNGGEGRIAKAQNKAQEDGKDPAIWKDVEQYLIAAGATQSKVQEIIQYVEKVLGYEQEFFQKSLAEKSLKSKDPKNHLSYEGDVDGHWITNKRGDRVFIKNKDKK